MTLCRAKNTECRLAPLVRGPPHPADPAAQTFFFFPQKLLDSRPREEARPVQRALPESGGRKHTRTWARYGIRVQIPDWLAGRQATPHPFPAQNWADDELRMRRTQHAARARTTVRAGQREGVPVRHRRHSRPASSAPPPPQLRVRLSARPPPQRGCWPRACLFKWWGLRAAPAAPASVAPRAAFEGRVKMAAALAL